MKYIVEIEFETERHCLLCPVRDEETNVAEAIPNLSWEEQMMLPLKLVEDKEVEWRECNKRILWEV